MCNLRSSIIVIYTTALLQCVKRPVPISCIHSDIDIAISILESKNWVATRCHFIASIVGL